MKNQAQKLDQKVKRQFPKASKLVEGHLTSTRSQKNKISEPTITRSEVQKLKEWINKVVQS